MTILKGHPVPDWVTVLAEKNESARILARTPLPTGTETEAYDLTIQYDDQGIVVSESFIGSRLPGRCPELHIVEDGKFCTGRRQNTFDTVNDSQIFWQELGHFLVGQQHALDRRHWPAGRWWSHGNIAADAQATAETIANQNGWADDYANAIENNAGWIAEAVRFGVGPPGVSNCPCGVGRGKRGRCPHRKAVERIVAAERKRRLAERVYLQGLFDDGLRCCGRVDGCRLDECARS